MVTLNILVSLCVFLFFPSIIILWWLCVIIYHQAPLSSVVLSTEPALSASFARTMASYINISLTRTVNCLLTKQKSYRQQQRCVCGGGGWGSGVGVFVRGRERGGVLG